MYQQEGEKTSGNTFVKIIAFILAVVAILFICRYVASMPDNRAGETTAEAEVCDSEESMAEIRTEMPAKQEEAKTVSDEVHLSFKGVPIDGTLNQFVSMMKAAGFATYKPKYGSNEASDSRIFLLQGDFAGFKGCIVKVSTLSNLDLVCKIFVQFAEQDTWSALYDDYSKLKTLLTKKYGKPSEVIEKVDSGYDFGDIYAIKYDHATFRRHLVLRLEQSFFQ